MAGSGTQPAGQSEYYLPDRWCLHLYTYHGTLTVDGAEFPIRPGACSLVPPAVRLVYDPFEPGGSHGFVHFQVPPPGEDALGVPRMQQLAGEFGSCFRTLQSVIRFRATDPARANVRLHDLLYTIAECGTADDDAYSHPVMRPLLEWIELHLAERFQVARICREFSLSHNYLNRLFRADLGCTIGAYIQQRRAERAIRLLTDTTIPIKAIAADLGYLDLAQFSTFIKRQGGQAPRRIRGALMEKRTCQQPEADAANE
jgi:AraC-like DNA-binding protein